MTLAELLTDLQSRQDQDHLPTYARQIEYALKAANSGIFTPDGDLTGKRIDALGREKPTSYPVSNLKTFVSELAFDFMQWEAAKDAIWIKAYIKQYKEMLFWIEAIAQKAGAKEPEIIMVRRILAKWAEKINNPKFKFSPERKLEERLINSIKKHVPEAYKYVIYDNISKLLSVVNIDRKPETIRRTYNRKIKLGT